MIPKAVEKELNDVVPRYVANKREADSYAALAKKDNEVIKDLLESAKLDEYAVGDQRVFISRAEKQEVDEEHLVVLLKRLGQSKGIVKKKEYVDMEKLEDALYHGEIHAADISQCFSTKETISLRIGKAKKES